MRMVSLGLREVAQNPPSPAHPGSPCPPPQKRCRLGWRRSRSSRGRCRRTWSSSQRGLRLRWDPHTPASHAPGRRKRDAGSSLRSQASESGSADEPQSQVLEWQEMVAEAASAPQEARQETAALALRISHMEEEREGETAAGRSQVEAEPGGSERVLADAWSCLTLLTHTSFGSRSIS